MARSKSNAKQYTHVVIDGSEGLWTYSEEEALEEAVYLIEDGCGYGALYVVKVIARVEEPPGMKIKALVTPLS